MTFFLVGSLAFLLLTGYSLLAINPRDDETN